MRYHRTYGYYNDFTWHLVLRKLFILCYLLPLENILKKDIPLFLQIHVKLRIKPLVPPFTYLCSQIRTTLTNIYDYIS